MEGNKHVASSSSLTTQLFGSMDTSYSSTTGIFGSIFAPNSSKVLGSDSLLSQAKEGERDYVNEQWIPNAEDPPNQGQKESQEEMTNKEMSSIYPEQRAQPCQFTSSIYYGGQDIYAHPQNSHNSGVVFKKVGGEDDSEIASRGNWWQGSLYY